MGEHQMHLPQPLKAGRDWLTKLLGSSVALLVVLVIALVAVAGYGGHKVMGILHDMKQTQEALLADMRVLNEQTIVREIIDEKVGDRLPPEQKALLATEIVTLARKWKVPMHIALAIPEVESQWTPNAQNGIAFGLYQVTLDTAMPLFREAHEAASPEKLLDPIRSANFGLQTLVDKHDTVIRLQKAPEDDWTRALWLYNGRGETYARKVLEASVAYQKRLEAPLVTRLAKM